MDCSRENVPNDQTLHTLGPYFRKSILYTVIISNKEFTQPRQQCSCVFITRKIEIDVLNVLTLSLASLGWSLLTISLTIGTRKRLKQQLAYSRVS